jgi:glyoxylase-like metal-dependent hydrolase (beta-lactamase superfamily II)
MGESNVKIYPLDLGFQGIPQAIAAYLVVGPEGPVLVETGPASTLEILKVRLTERGFTPADIRQVLVTHIHLDHAGAAGWWARQGTDVYVHHVGAPHLVDPSRLLSSAQRIYGSAMDTLWGETVPAPAERVHPLRDNDTVKAGGLTFIALDTPGHARHHHVFRLGEIAFTGDAAAVRLPGNPFISLPAPPPEFDREAWLETIARLLDQDLITIYPTHFGPLADVRAHLQALADLIDRSAEFVRSRMQAGLGRDELARAYLAWVEERAHTQGLSESDFEVYETANPTSMSVDGIVRYWRKRAKG